MKRVVLQHGTEYLCYRKGEPSLLLLWDNAAEMFAPSLTAIMANCFPPDAFDGVVSVDDAIKRRGLRIKVEGSNGTH